MRYFLIINPLSKGGKCQKTFKKLFNTLNNKGISYDYKIISSINEALNLTRQKAIANYNAIVAVGGDGTINTVINGMYNTNGYLISKAQLGVIYTGTSPDFCKSYGIPIKLTDAIKCLLQNKTHAIPIAQIKYSRLNNSMYTDVDSIKYNDLLTGYYACCANFGIGPSLATKANSGIREKFGDKMGTFLALISILRKKKECTLQIICDQQNEKIHNLLNLSVGRTRYVASGIQYHCGLFPGEKKLYGVFARNINFYHLLTLLFNLYSGRQFKNKPSLFYKYLHQIDINYNNNFPEIEMDGDVVGYLPCKIQLAKDELSIITNL